MKKYIDITLIKILASFYGVVVIISFLKTAYSIINEKNLEIGPYDWAHLFFRISILDWIIVTLFMIVISISTKKMFEKRVKLKFVILTHLFLSLIIGWIIFFFSSIILLLIGKINYASAIDNVSFSHVMRTIDINFITYFLMTGIIYVYYYVHKVSEIETQKIQLLNQLTTTKMQILKSQLQPHFLFNTLNSIHSLMESDKEKSQNMLVDLSELLREIIDLKNENLIELQEEVLLLNKYLRIQKNRFSDDLKIELNVNQKLDNILMPAMLLQPIIENAIKHGYSKKNLTLIISVNIYKLGRTIVFSIKNNGMPLKIPLKKLINNGRGIKNVIERLKTLYRENYKFEMYNSEFGVTTKITIPYKAAEYKLMKHP